MKSVIPSIKADVNLSVVLPVYNEAESIETVLRELHKVLSAMPLCSFEIIAVNDGSSDHTLDIMKRLKSELTGLNVISLLSNSGQSAAFSAGFRLASGRITIAMDADGQNDPGDIPRLVAELKDCDCCCGYRARRMDTWSRRVGSRMANAIRNIVLDEDTIDTGCSLKAFRTELGEDFPPLNGMHRFIPSYMLMKGAVIKHIPVNHRPRSLGTSKYTNLGRLSRTIWDLFAIVWMKSRYKRFTVEENK